MNILKSLLTLALCLMFAQLKAQTEVQNQPKHFYSLIDSAYRLSKAGDGEQALNTLDASLDKMTYIHQLYLDFGIKIAQKLKDQKRIEYYKEFIKKQRTRINPELIQVFDSLIVVDQKVRSGKYSRAATYRYECLQEPDCDKSSKKYKKAYNLWKTWQITDSLNAVVLMNLYQTYGYIGEELLGEEHFVKAYIILTHFDSDSNNAIAGSYMSDALQSGKMRPMHYAQIIDRRSHLNKETQVYWTAPYPSKEKPFEKDDIPTILKKREELYLFGTTLSLIETKNGWYTSF
ncbi:MAG: hypothetical protein ACPG4W_04505 [Flavobacteriales bacterium]